MVLVERFKATYLPAVSIAARSFAQSLVRLRAIERDTGVATLVPPEAVLRKAVIWAMEFKDGAAGGEFGPGEPDPDEPDPAVDGGAWVGVKLDTVI
jgi:hypothetical protein